MDVIPGIYMDILANLWFTYAWFTAYKTTLAHFGNLYLKLDQTEIQVMDFVLFDRLFQKVLQCERIQFWEKYNECLQFRENTEVQRY